MSMFSGMAAQGWGAIGGAVGDVKAGEAAKKGFDYKAQVARNNQILANQAAETEIKVGDQHASIALGRGTAKREGFAADVGARNLDLGPDTSQGGVLRDIEVLRDLDSNTIRNNSARKAYAHLIRSSAYGAEATMDSYLGGEAEEAGNSAGAFSLISGVGSVGSKWSNYQSKTGKSETYDPKGSGDDESNRNSLESGDNWGTGAEEYNLDL